MQKHYWKLNGFYNSNGLEGKTIDNPQTQLGAWSFLSHKITPRLRDQLREGLDFKSDSISLEDDILQPIRRFNNQINLWGK